MSFQDLRASGKQVASVSGRSHANGKQGAYTPVKLDTTSSTTTPSPNTPPPNTFSSNTTPSSKRTDAPSYGPPVTPPMTSARRDYPGAPQPGGLASQAASSQPTSDPEVTRGVFQMNTAVSSFKRLVNSLGTPKDTLELRQKLHKSRQYVTQLGKDIAGKLKDASARDHAAGVSTAKKLSDAKLAKDFQSILREFEKAQHMAVEREAAYEPHEAPSTSAAASKGKRQLQYSGQSSNGASNGPSYGESISDPLLREQQRQEMLTVESEVAYTEAVIEEREQGIQEIQHQILEVNEIFRDLAVLVKEQGVMIDDIEANIENTHAQSVQANKQLQKAAKSQKESNSFVCWVMAVFAIGLFIFFLIMSS